MLTYRYCRDPMSGALTGNIKITSDGECDGPHWGWDPATDEDEPIPAATLAHVGFEIVAQVLAAPLRRAWREHWDLPHGHEPGNEERGLPYRAYCAECGDLLALLPAADVPVVLG